MTTTYDRQTEGSYIMEILWSLINIIFTAYRYDSSLSGSYGDITCLPSTGSRIGMNKLILVIC